MSADTNRFLRPLIAGVLITLLIVIFAVWFFRAVESSGSVSDFGELRPVYKSASRTFVQFHRTTILKEFPFAGPIVWQCSSIRPTVSLKGRVDVAAFNS